MKTLLWHHLPCDAEQSSRTDPALERLRAELESVGSLLGAENSAPNPRH